VKRIHFAVMITALLGGATVAASELPQPGQSRLVPEAHNQPERIVLPAPNYDGKVSVEQALRRRRSVREYKDEPLTLKEVSQLLWAAQGITDAERGLRTAPSAGATYPLEVYVVVGNVEAVKQGAYKYNPREHQLIKVRDADGRAELAAALGQAQVRNAGALIVFFAVYERTTAKFGDVGTRYVQMEVGHAAQNVYLQAASLNLGTTVIGGFPEKQVKKILSVPENEQPLYVMPVGRQ
jgi:SagB-type dehydrogenase family enzyme